MPSRLFLVVLTLGVHSCSGVTVTGAGRTDEPAAPANAILPALASAGPDLEVLRGFTTHLTAAGTSHPNGKSYTLHWTQSFGEPVLLSSENALCPSFLAPLLEQDLGFRLTVDDGTYRTFDDVVIRVRAEPRLKAPAVAAGPDRMLDQGEAATPTVADVASTLATDTTITWTAVETATSGQTPSRTVAPEAPGLFRLTAERYGMSSAPDYLVLMPFDAALIGRHAPTASLTGLTVAEPGVQTTLDASASADPNGDAIALRWERTASDQACAELATTARVEVALPNRPQEVSYRVFAHDGRFESAPAELTIAVSMATGAPPLVAPGLDRRTRPGRVVQLDALGAAPNSSREDLDTSYLWHQTIGPEVTLDASDTGRMATFTAPSVPASLAFGVVATIGTVESAPAVLVVEVMGDEVNTAPAVYLTSATADLPSDDWLMLTATAMDPEEDPIDHVTWSVENDQLTIEPLTECLAPGGQAQARVFIPASVTTLTVSAEACDDRDACGNTAITLDAP